MSVQVAAWVWGNRDIPRAEKYVLLAYADFSSRDGSAIRPYVSTIVQMTGYSERQVRELTASLEDLGVLVRCGKSRNGQVEWRVDLNWSKRGRCENLTKVREPQVQVSPDRGAVIAPMGCEKQQVGGAKNSRHIRKNHQLPVTEPPTRKTSPIGDAGAEEFDSWYAEYPRKVKKEDAKRAWESLAGKRQLPALAVLLDSVASHKKLKQWSDPQYIPYPASFLRGKMWEDEDLGSAPPRTPDDLAFAVKVYARYAWSWTDVYERLSLVPPPAPDRESCIEPILRARDTLSKTYPDAEQRIWEAMCEANKDKFLRGANPKFPTPSFSIEKILEISQYRNKPIELSNAYRSKPPETRDIHPDDIEDESVDSRSMIVLESMQSELLLYPKGADGPSH